MTKNELMNRGNISHKTNNAAIKARQSEELELATKAFLAKKGNEKLLIKTIESWSSSEGMWIRRASMVILLKSIMVKKEFDGAYVFALCEKMLKYKE